MPRPAGKKSSANVQMAPSAAADHAEHDAWLQRASAIMAEEVLPGIEAFRGFMAAQQRRLEVLPFLDHIEGPQVMLRIARPDGQITATLKLEVTPAGIRPSWLAESTGRVKTRWTENVRGGVSGVTQDAVRDTLIAFYETDFS